MPELSTEVVSRAAFSYESMMYAAEWLVWHQDDKTLEPGMWNAHVDSFLLHARRLHDLIVGERRSDDDLVLQDLLEQAPNIALPQTAEFRGRMNKRILHLTHHAEPEFVSWPVELISRELATAMDRVIEAMAEGGSIHHDRFVRARNGQPGFRKLIM